MQLTRSLFGFLGGIVKARRDRVIDVMPAWSGATTAALNNSWQRIEQVNHFRGWNYVAIKAIAEEVGGFQPIVAKRHAAADVRSAYRKALASGRDRRDVNAEFQSRFLTANARRKALTNIRSDDTLEQVSQDHPLYRILLNPNGPDVAWTFWYKVMMYLELTGAAYMWAPPAKINVDDRPSQLWVLPSQWVYEIPGKDQLIGEYEIRPTNSVMVDAVGAFGAGWFPGAGGIERRPASEIIKIAYPSPFSIIDGYSPVGAIGAWIDVSNNIDRSRVQTFANGAFPGVALEMDKDVANPDQEEIARVKSRFREAYQGVRNTGEVVVLSPGIRVVPFSRTNVEMDYAASADQVRGSLMSAHRVPQSIAGLVEQSTYANADASRANFYGSCLKPKLTLAGQVLTEKLAKRYNDDLVIYWDDPTPNDPEMRLRKYETMHRNSVVTPNEWRQAEGFEPWEHGGDDPVGNPMSAQPLGWATGEQPMDQMQQLMGGGGMGGGMGDGGGMGGEQTGDAGDIADIFGGGMQ